MRFVAAELVLLAVVEVGVAGGNQFRLGRLLPHDIATTSNFGTAIALLVTLLLVCPAILGVVGARAGVVWVACAGSVLWPLLFVRLERLQFGSDPSMLLGGSIIEVAVSGSVSAIAAWLTTRMLHARQRIV